MVLFGGQAVTNLSNYPAGFDTPTDTFTGASSMAGVHAQHHDLLADAVYNMQQTAGPVFSVKAYGAVGGGVTDDTAAINLAAAAATARPGSTLFFPFADGGYKTTGNHAVGTSLVGRVRVDLGGNTITHTGNNACFVVRAHAGADFRCTVQNGIIEGNSGTSARGIEIIDSFRTHLLGLKIANYSGGDGILLHNVAFWTEEATLIGVHLYRNKYGIRLLADAAANPSFGHQRWLDVSVNVPASGFGISLDGQNLSGVTPLYFYDSVIKANFWSATGSTVLDIGPKVARLPTGTLRGGYNRLDLFAEPETGATGLTGVRSQAASTFLATGVVDLWNDTFSSRQTNTLNGVFDFRSDVAEDWREIGAAGNPAFQNNLVNNDAAAYNTIAFAKQSDTVRFKGVGKLLTIGTTGFTLPAGYRPALAAAYKTLDGAIYVFADGQVQLIGASANTFISFEGITFRAATP